eukprot:scaffold10995_cov115-Skeletonema_marinoi.AAC.7
MPKRRRVCKAWGESETMQQRRLHKQFPESRNVQKAWGIMDKEDVQPRCSSDGCTNQVKIGGVGVCIGMEQKSNDAAARDAHMECYRRSVGEA